MEQRPFRRIVLLILDSVGVGEMPDAAEFGDEGSNTLGHVAASRKLRLANLERLGLGNIGSFAHISAARPALGGFGKSALASRGKDTTSGHWEMMGLILDSPFPVYPQGFPDEIMKPFEEAIGRLTLGNYPASGTEIIRELGEQHLKTGGPIIYTSADSVFQIAAHEERISVEELYRMCEIARKLLQGKHRVGRVIARPFVGTPGNFTRTERRKDYAIPPIRSTVLDHLQTERIPVTAIGKIASIFCYRGITRELKTRNNHHTGEITLAALREFPEGLIFANYVDFDMLYGHRNDVEGYAMALEEFDLHLGVVLGRLADGDLLMLASDHGCDPSTASTDHSREYTLLLTFSRSGKKDIDLGIRRSLADIGATVAGNFHVEAPAGTSFLSRLI